MRINTCIIMYIEKVQMACEVCLNMNLWKSVLFKTLLKRNGQMCVKKP